MEEHQLAFAGGAYGCWIARLAAGDTFVERAKPGGSAIALTP